MKFYSFETVETIVPEEENKTQETIVLKSDGTTEKLIQKMRTSRTSIHQEKHAKQEKHEKREFKEKDEKRERQEKQEMTEKSESSEMSDKPRLGRALTSQEESILLPLLQGLLAANTSDISKCKHENTPAHDKEQSNSSKDSRSNSLTEKSDKSESLSSQ